jgi:uncharacterized membrane protein YphA (DoxX/SURF4 family)
VWLYVATSLLGFLNEPSRENVFAVAGYVVVITGLTAFLHWVLIERAMSADRVVTVALATSGLPMALSAIFTFLGPAGLVLGLLLLALAAIATAEQVGALLTAEAGEAGRAAATPAETAGTHDAPALAALPTSTLTRQWGACGGDLDGVQLRADIIDELERRDPFGVERWIRDGVAASPANYVRDDGLSA